jgi:hypothetical protein
VDDLCGAVNARENVSSLHAVREDSEMTARAVRQAMRAAQWARASVTQHRSGAMLIDGSVNT